MMTRDALLMLTLAREEHIWNVLQYPSAAILISLAWYEFNVLKILLMANVYLSV